MSESRITKDEVKSISDFSRLSLDEDEAEDLVGQLNEILDYFNKIDEADTEGVEPLFGLHDRENVLSEDVVEESLPQELALENAENVEKGYFKSPRVRD